MVYNNSSIDAVYALEDQRTEGYINEKNELVYNCSSCSGEIYDGDDCLVCENGSFCRNCVMAMTSDDVVELLGYSFKTAQMAEM